MIATQRLAVSRLATVASRNDVAPILHSGRIALITQNVGIKHSGLLAKITQSVIVKNEHKGAIARFSQTVSTRHSGRIARFAQSVSSAQQQYPFSENVGFDGFGAFGIRIVTEVGEIDPCAMMDAIEITFEEDKAALAKAVFKQNTGERVDLFKHLNKQMRIELTRPNKPAFVLYEGKFDASTYQIGNLWIEWSAVAPRERLFERMSDAQIKAIGVHDVNVFRKLDDYDDKKTLVVDRLSTVPASLDFINGNPVVTPWMPKLIADYTLDACEILRTGANNSVLTQENIKNKVTVKIQNQWDLLYHAKRGYTFNCNYSVCDYSAWGLPPMNSTIKSAAQATGWILLNYASKGLHPGGVYMCSWRGGYPEKMMWRPKSSTFNKMVNDKGEVVTENDDEFYDRTVTDYTNVYAQEASFDLVYEWSQPIEESIEVTVQNSASIGRYGEREDTLNVNVYQDRSKSTNRTLKRWGESKVYKNPEKRGAVRQSNGYWILRADNIEKGLLQSALNVAKRVAEVMILSSHRSIELTLRSKSFAPQFNVTQTHNVDFQHVRGRFKVARVVHKLDLANKWAHSEVTYKLFANAENQAYAVQQIEPPRAALNLFANPTYESELKVHNIPLGATVYDSEDEFEDAKDNDEIVLWQPTFTTASDFYYYTANGWITETYGEDRGLEFRRERDFQVIASEIEEESTDTMEINIKKTVEMGVPNDEQELTA